MTDAVRWSPASYRLHGYEPGEVDPCLELMLEHTLHADRRSARSALALARESGRPLHILSQIEDARGRPRMVVTVATAVPQRQGAGHLYVGHLIDVSRGSARILSRGEHVGPYQPAVDQAVGVLVALLQITPRAALTQLRHRAVKRSVRVDRLAAEFMRGCRSTAFTDSNMEPAAVRRLLTWAARRA